MVQNGLGFALTFIGILGLLSVFHCNLHSIRDRPSSRNSRILKYLSYKFVIFCIVVTLIIGFSTPMLLFTFHNSPNIYIIHIHNILTMAIVAIIIPKYYINQDPNMKLYVSVYHCQPPPILPWQLPRSFDPNSVKLICVSHKNE